MPDKWPSQLELNPVSIAWSNLEYCYPHPTPPPHRGDTSHCRVTPSSMSYVPIGHLCEERQCGSNEATQQWRDHPCLTPLALRTSHWKSDALTTIPLHLSHKYCLIIIIINGKTILMYSWRLLYKHVALFLWRSQITTLLPFIRVYMLSMVTGGLPNKTYKIVEGNPAMDSIFTIVKVHDCRFPIAVVCLIPSNYDTCRKTNIKPILEFKTTISSVFKWLFLPPTACTAKVSDSPVSK